MEKFVEHVVEPSQLLLAWQAPDHMESRRRWVVARVDVKGSPWTMKYLRGTEFELANPGASFDHLLSLGFEGYPAFNLRGADNLFDRGVHDAFMRRLPPRARPDFAMYIRRFGFLESSKLSDPVLLAYTEAKLPSDGFSLVGDLLPSLEVGDLIFDLAGTRHQGMGEICPANVGDPLYLRREPANEHDPDAIEVLWNETRIGYINRLQAKAVGFWLDHRSVHMSVQRVNGRSGSPKVYALMQVRPLSDSIAA